MMIIIWLLLCAVTGVIGYAVGYGDAQRKAAKAEQKRQIEQAMSAQYAPIPLAKPAKKRGRKKKKS